MVIITTVGITSFPSKVHIKKFEKHLKKNLIGEIIKISYEGFLRIYHKFSRTCRVLHGISRGFNY